MSDDLASVRAAVDLADVRPAPDDAHRVRDRADHRDSQPSVFVSYSRDDGDLARTVIEALQREGLSVWWDGRVALGTEWDLQIDDELRRAACVVVLWTAASARSRWVRSEAREAYSVGSLLSVLIGEDSRRPVEFSSVQGIALGPVGDELADDDRRTLVAGVRAVMERAPLIEASPATSRRRRARRGLAAVAAAAVTVAGGVTAVVLSSSGTGTHVRAVTLGERPWDVAVTPQAVWVTDQTEGFVWRRDRATGTAASTVVSGALELAHSPTGRTLAVSSSTAKDTISVMVDGGTPQPFATGAVVDDMAMDDRTVWVAQNAAGTVTALDVATGAVRWSVPVVGVLSLVADDGGVWVTSASDRAGRLSRLDPATGRILASTATGEEPVGITTFDGEVWVGDRSRGTVEIFDRTLHRIATVAAGAGLLDLASDAHSVWVSSSASAELVVIDGRTRRVTGRHPAPGRPFKIDGDATLVAASSPTTGELVLATR